MEQDDSNVKDKTNYFNDNDLIFAMGIRFWSELVISQNITNFKECLDVLETINGVLGSKQSADSLTIVSGESKEVENLQSDEEELINITPGEMSKKHKCEFCDFQHNQFVFLKVITTVTNIWIFLGRTTCC